VCDAKATRGPLLLFLDISKRRRSPLSRLTLGRCAEKARVKVFRPLISLRQVLRDLRVSVVNPCLPRRVEVLHHLPTSVWTELRCRFLS